MAADAGGGVGSQENYIGGTIKKVTYCTCYYDPGVVLEIKKLYGDKQTVKLFFSFFTAALTLKANYNVFESGPNVIAAYTSGSHKCQDTRGYYCSGSKSADGTIDIIGTSSK